MHTFHRTAEAWNAEQGEKKERAQETHFSDLVALLLKKCDRKHKDTEVSVFVCVYCVGGCLCMCMSACICVEAKSLDTGFTACNLIFEAASSIADAAWQQAPGSLLSPSPQ